ncbi:MAG: hypothetical protein WCQ47_05865 [bacterium]
MIKGLLIVFLFSISTIILCEENNSSDFKDMQVACTIINGKLKDGEKCVKIQKKFIEARCKKGDPNACNVMKRRN